MHAMAHIISLSCSGSHPLGPRQVLPRGVGLCAIVGCSQTQFQLEGGGAHHRRRCGIVVHNTCAQERSWFVEDDLGVHTRNYTILFRFYQEAEQL
jgi:hypothetical protein